MKTRVDFKTAYGYSRYLNREARIFTRVNTRKRTVAINEKLMSALTNEQDLCLKLMKNNGYCLQYGMKININ